VIVLAGARVVTPSGVIDPGWVKIENSSIAAIGNGRPPSDRVTDLGGAWLLPGYVDLHVHGGAGGRIDASADELATAVALHRQHGTTRTLASLVTGPLDAMCAAAGWIADAVEAGPTPEGHVVGVHFEGPFISAARCGAQNVDAMLEPDSKALAQLIEAARGTARMITIAPELPGGIDLVRQAVEAGLIAAVGHTDAHYEQAMAAFDAGASVLTHAFNGMRGLHHRDPGSIGAGSDRADIVFEAINDGFHLHDAALRLLTTIAPGRVALITDAMAAAGVGDGEYTLGEKKVIVSGGKAVLADGGSIAGSSLTMDRAVARAVREVGLPIEVASAAASGTPARVLGGADRFGSIAVGLDADLVVLDDDLAVARVMAQGHWVAGEKV
jgi:N-acetylglucosamine-6-phosphate deacetylase